MMLTRKLKRIACVIAVIMLISIYLEMKRLWSSKVELTILHFQSNVGFGGSKSSEDSKDRRFANLVENPRLEYKLSHRERLSEKPSTDLIKLTTKTTKTTTTTTTTTAATTTTTKTDLSHGKSTLTEVTWKSFDNFRLDGLYQMAYASPDAHATTQSAKEACLRLGCAAITVETNGWVEYFRNVPSDRSQWIHKPRCTMWVIGQYLDGTVKQPSLQYGCSRHKHACKENPAEGSAPCCANVMLEVMLDLSRVLRKHGIHWRLTQGQQLSVVRDGIIQQFDHDFDPRFEAGTLKRVKDIIEREMHLAGKSSKYREADYYYTKKVAARLKTNWSRYSVMGGDFGWGEKRYQNPYTLQRNPGFMDVGQAHHTEPTQDNTFPCLIGKDILCTRNWYHEVTSEFKSGYQAIPPWYPSGQVTYSAHYQIRRKKDNLMFDDNGVERNAAGRAEMIDYYISLCPEFWTKPCSV